MTLNRLRTPALWVLYQAIARIPFSVRKAIVSWFVSRLFRRRMPKIKRNIRLLRSDLNDNQVEQAISELKAITVENYAVLLGSRKLKMRKEVLRLKVTGHLEEVLDLYRKGRKIVVVAPHIGPFDLELFLFLFFVRNNLVPVKLLVYIPVEDLQLEAITSDLRKAAGDGIVFERIKRGETLLKAAQYLGKGYIMGMAIDMIRKGKDNRGVVCRIGDNAEGVFPVGCVKLSRDENAIIVPVFPSVELKGKTLMLLVDVGKPLLPKKTVNEKEDIENDVRTLVKMYDFRKYVDQWMKLTTADLEERGNAPDS